MTPAPGRSEGTAPGRVGGGKARRRAQRTAEPYSRPPGPCAARRRVCRMAFSRRAVPAGVKLKAKTPTLGRRGCRRAERRARTKRRPKTNLGFSASGKKTVKKKQRATARCFFRFFCHVRAYRITFAERHRFFLSRVPQRGKRTGGVDPIGGYPSTAFSLAMHFQRVDMPRSLLGSSSSITMSAARRSRSGWTALWRSGRCGRAVGQEPTAARRSRSGCGCLPRREPIALFVQAFCPGIDIRCQDNAPSISQFQDLKLKAGFHFLRETSADFQYRDDLSAHYVRAV